MSSPSKKHKRVGDPKGERRTRERIELSRQEVQERIASGKSPLRIKGDLDSARSAAGISKITVPNTSKKTQKTKTKSAKRRSVYTVSGGLPSLGKGHR